MTSPVDTSVKNFNSAMANAPVLSGTAGSLIALLDACLKDGFDTKTLVSLVIASGVATATWSGTHSAQVDSVILVAGVTGGPTGWAGLNGEQKVVTKPGATSVTFATTLPDGAATGTIAMKMAPAGWLKPFTGTNLAAYQSGDVTSTKMLLRIDDTGTTSARVVGYESMSDINTGLGSFPTPAQMSGGGYWAKSQNANASAVQWSLHCDGKVFYLNIQSGTSAASTQQIAAGRMFGDIVPYKPGGDAYACTLNYSSNSAVASMFDSSVGACTTTGKHATPRDYTGVGSAVINSINVFGNANTSMYSGITGTILGSFPSAIDGGLWVAPKYLALPTSLFPRGLLPGIYHCLQSALYNTFKQGDTTPGSGALAGRTLKAATTCDESTAFTSASASNNTGIVFFDVTGPWR